MKITAVGVGSAFSNKLFNQCYMVEEEDRRLFIDLGQQIIPFALNNLGLKVSDIDDVWISHLHADHIGSLEALAFQRYDWIGHCDHWSKRKSTNRCPRLFIKKGLDEKLWNESLRGGLKNSIQWFDATLESFFEVVPITSIHFDWQGWTCTPIQQVHISAFADIVPSYGLMFEKPGHKTVYFTTDSQHITPKQMVDFYAKCDLVFQDCETGGINLKFQEGEKVYRDGDAWNIWPKDSMEATILLAQGKEPEPWEAYKFSSGVHASYGELAGYDSANAYKLKPTIKSRIWLSHYGDHVVDGKDSFGNPVNWDEQAKKDGFAGFVKIGQVFEL